MPWVDPPYPARMSPVSRQTSSEQMRERSFRAVTDVTRCFECGFSMYFGSRHKLIP